MKNTVTIHHAVRRAAKRWSEHYGVTIEPSYGIRGGYIVNGAQIDTLPEVHAYCQRMSTQYSR